MTNRQNSPCWARTYDANVKHGLSTYSAGSDVRAVTLSRATYKLSGEQAKTLAALHLHLSHILGASGNKLQIRATTQA